MPASEESRSWLAKLKEKRNGGRKNACKTTRALVVGKDEK